MCEGGGQELACRGKGGAGQIKPRQIPIKDFRLPLVFPQPGTAHHPTTTATGCPRIGGTGYHGLTAPAAEHVTGAARGKKLDGSSRLTLG